MLTELECKNARGQLKRYRLYDERGMYLEVLPNGSRYFRMKFRFEGTEKLLALGVYPEVSLKVARDKRDQARKLLEEGVNPGVQRKTDRSDAQTVAENQFEAVAREWHLKNHQRWTKKHSSQVLHSLEQDVFPFIGQRQIAGIQASDLLPLLRKIEERGALEIAKRIMQRCGSVFRFGVATGRCSRNPVSDLVGALEQPRRKGMAAVSPQAVPELLRAIRVYTGRRITKIALEMMSLTFVRTTELIQAKWDEVSVESAEWRIPAERMKMKEHHIVPLSLQVIALLKEAKELSGGSEFIFPHESNADLPMSNNTLIYSLHRMNYKGRMTGHGFRVIASTILNEMGFRPDIIEKQLAHVERNKVRSAYNRAEYLEERRQMMQVWANHLDALREGAKVIPFNRTG